MAEPNWVDLQRKRHRVRVKRRKEQEEESQYQITPMAIELISLLIWLGMPMPSDEVSFEDVVVTAVLLGALLGNEEVPSPASNSRIYPTFLWMKSNILAISQAVIEMTEIAGKQIN